MASILLTKIYSQRKHAPFVAVRLISFFIIGFETFFGPKIVGIANYGIIEFEKQVLNLSLIFLFGAHSGYGILHYTANEEIRDSDYLYGGVIHSLLIFIVMSLLLYNDFFSFGILFILGAVLLEQILKIKNKFSAAILFKPLTSLLLLLFYCIYFFFKDIPFFSMRININILYFLSFFVFLILVSKHLKHLKINEFRFKNYLKFIKKGFEPNLTSALILLFFFIDRFIIEKYYNSLLGVYSTAYNFSYLAFLMGTSVGYVTTTKIGEKMRSIGELHIFLKKLIKLSFIFMVSTLVTIIPLVFFINHFWFDLPHFTPIAIINLVSRSIFGGAAIVSSVIFYKNLEHYLWKFLLIGTFSVIAIDWMLLKYFSNAFYMIQIVSSGVLILYSLYIFLIIKNKIVTNEFDQKT